MIVTILLLGGGLTLWQINMPSRVPRDKIDAIFFLNANHGFIQVVESPHTSAYETLDGGETWKRIDEGVPGFRRGRSFATKSKGWSIDENSFDHSTVYRTEDGGSTWVASFKTQQSVSEFVFGGLQAISEEEAWAIGLSGTYHTVDGGKAWEVAGPAGTGVQFLDAKRGWIDGDKLWRTDNGGKTWESVESDGKSCFGGLGFFFLDEKHAWAVGGQTEGHMEGGAQTGFVTASTDGGKTCEETTRIPDHYFWSVFFLNEQEGWVGGIGSLLKTADGGQTWTEVKAK